MGYFMFKYKNSYYDITGKVKRPDDLIDFDTLYYQDANLFSELMRDCVLKNLYYPRDDNEWCKK